MHRLLFSLTSGNILAGLRNLNVSTPIILVRVRSACGYRSRLALSQRGGYPERKIYERESYAYSKYIAYVFVSENVGRVPSWDAVKLCNGYWRHQCIFTGGVPLLKPHRTLPRNFFHVCDGIYAFPCHYASTDVGIYSLVDRHRSCPVAFKYAQLS